MKCVLTAEKWSNYTAFGNPLPGRQYISGQKYRYGYQSQEQDPEIWGGAVSFKYRIEDPRLGRFFSTDPLEGHFPWNSPYAFSENRVIDGIELEGLEVVALNKTKDPVAYEAASKDKDKSVISVYAHGENRGIVISAKGVATKIKNWATSAKEFDKILSKSSPEYRDAKKSGKAIVIVLHSCRTGEDYTDKNNVTTPAIAKQISTLPNTTVIAPDERLTYSQNKEEGAYESGPRKGAYGTTDRNGDWKKDDNKKYSKEEGNWNTFKDGKQVDQNKDLNKAKDNAKKEE